MEKYTICDKLLLKTLKLLKNLIKHEGSRLKILKLQQTRLYSRLDEARREREKESKGSMLGRRSDAETSANRGVRGRVQIHPRQWTTKGGATICTNQRKRVESRKRGENFRGNIRKSLNASSRRSGNVISPVATFVHPHAPSRPSTSHCYTLEGVEILAQASSTRRICARESIFHSLANTRCLFISGERTKLLAST